jgi:hypothetical protein
MIKNENKYIWTFFLFLVIVLHLFILSRLIFFPYPELFIYPYLTADGLLPYKQILDQHFPGLMFFPINLFSLGMRTPEIARIWHLGLIAVTQITLYWSAKKNFKSKKWALFANSLFLLWQPFFEGYVFWIDSFIPLFLLPAFCLLVDFNSKKIDTQKLFLSGLLLGMALVFKQVTLPLILLVGLFVLWRVKKIKKLSPFVLGTAIPGVLMFAYICSIGVWRDFIFWTVTFNLTTFAQMGRKYPDVVGLVKTAPVFLLASVAWIAIFLKVKRPKSKMIDTYFLLGLFFLGSLVFAYARFDFIHLQPALPFAILILIFAVKKFFRKKAVLMFLTYISVSLFLLVPFYQNHIDDRVLFFGEFEDRLVNKVQRYVSEGDVIFALGTTPHLYQLTNTLPPGNIFVFQFPWFMVEAEERILSGIMNDPPKVVVRDMGATTGGLNLISYMSNINRYIEGNYEIVDQVDEVEIMIRK